VIERGGEKRPSNGLETTGRWIEEGTIAYIKAPSWNDPRFQVRAMEFLQQFKAARGLIVDVRGNTGGSSPITFVNALMDRPWRWWAEATTVRFGLFAYHAASGRSGFSPFAQPTMMWPSETGEGDALYTGRLILLVDERSHSASEDFVMPFKDTGRATIVGTPTAGSTGQPYREDLGDRMTYAIGTKREYFPDGSRFEGVGITPDALVTPRPDDLRRGADVELERALAILREVK
jgi:carboxyl-terminal processing protease